MFISASSGLGYYVITNYMFISYMFASIVGIVIYMLFSTVFILLNKLEERKK